MENLKELSQSQSQSQSQSSVSHQPSEPLAIQAQSQPPSSHTISHHAGKSDLDLEFFGGQPRKIDSSSLLDMPNEDWMGQFHTSQPSATSSQAAEEDSIFGDYAKVEAARALSPSLSRKNSTASPHLLDDNASM